MKKFIICKGFMAIINFDANSDISFEQSNLYLSHDISRFITSDKVFQKIANCIGSFLKGYFPIYSYQIRSFSNVNRHI